MRKTRRVFATHPLCSAGAFCWTKPSPVGRTGGVPYGSAPGFGKPGGRECAVARLPTFNARNSLSHCIRQTPTHKTVATASANDLPNRCIRKKRSHRFNDGFGVRNFRVKEATARIKINTLLNAAGWRFFANEKGPANVQLEPSVTLKAKDLDALGSNFEKTEKGFIDFLLLNEKGFPFVVLEANAENKSPLIGKEQARNSAKSQNCRFILLSNGNLHYFWDLERGNPYIITTFPSPTSVTGYQKTTLNPKQLIEEVVDGDYVVLTQRPGYANEAAWKTESERPRFIEIVAEIEAEQALVATNRELITGFEKKIQATLARIWGETAPEAGSAAAR